MYDYMQFSTQIIFDSSIYSEHTLYLSSYTRFTQAQQWLIASDWHLRFSMQFNFCRPLPEMVRIIEPT